MAAELQIVLLQLRRGPSLQVRDWKAYLVKSLLNRASRLAGMWRNRGERESSFDAWPVEPTESEPPRPTPHLKSMTDFRLGNSDRRLLKQLASFDGNVSRLAKHLGQHRNTIHRRLRQIRRTRNYFEIESATPETGSPSTLERARLVAQTTNPKTPPREVRRTLVILDLIEGLTYEQIVRRRHTSMATIARWRARFGKHGIAGLKALHRGRRPKHRAQSHEGNRSQ